MCCTWYFPENNVNNATSFWQSNSYLGSPQLLGSPLSRNGWVMLWILPHEEGGHGGCCLALARQFCWSRRRIEANIDDTSVFAREERENVASLFIILRSHQNPKRNPSHVCLICSNICNVIIVALRFGIYKY